jgi:hypothetical protein
MVLRPVKAELKVLKVPMVLMVPMMPRPAKEHPDLP